MLKERTGRTVTESLPELPEGAEIYVSGDRLRLMDEGEQVLVVMAPAIESNRTYVEDALARAAKYRREMIRAGRAAQFAARIGDRETEARATMESRVARGLYDSATADSMGVIR